LVAAGLIMGITVEDHIVVAGGGHFSFAANGLILPSERQ